MKKFPYTSKKTSRQKLKDAHPKESEVFRLISLRSSGTKCRHIFAIAVYCVSVLWMCVVSHELVPRSYLS